MLDRAFQRRTLPLALAALAVAVVIVLIACSRSRPEPSPPPRAEESKPDRVVLSTRQIPVLFGDREISLATAANLEVNAQALDLTPDQNRQFKPGDTAYLADDRALDGSLRGVALFTDQGALRFIRAPEFREKAALLQQIIDDQRVFAVPRGTVVEVLDILDPNLPLARRSVKLRLKPGGETAWVEQGFLR